MSSVGQVDQPKPEENKYELARLERIAANKARLQGLNVVELAQAVAEEFKKTSTVRIRNRKPAIPRQHIEPTRRSGRVIGRPSNYFERQEAAEDREFRAASRKKRPRTIPEDDCEPASAAAQAAASKAAYAFAEEKSGYVKHMSYSQVRRGFWCSIPSAMLDAYPMSKEKHHFDMRCQEDAPPEGFAEETQAGSKTWKVVWLPREGNSGKAGKGRHSLGTGFSGGWRGFALDHQLTSNDLVVFCVMQAAGKPAYLDATIFRTAEHESA